ncbi:hypothetical protein [Viridibacillus arvi]|uniref:hypothetical protein n=1 Tax=Viridibacillus arvi TaxID=263475 RepID=UPI00187B8375|nr:hypothetical protein [Viridibacillus sp. JNUCC-6]QOV12310.1 hypothetical protein JNUCC6_06000 [Viridibacillus sp. JNUCC-6]
MILSQKLFVANLTAMFTFFILPLFFIEENANDYFIGFIVSSVTIPFIFTFGLLTSMLIGKFCHKYNLKKIISFLLHIVSGVICLMIFAVYIFITGGSPEGYIQTGLMIALLCVTVFFYIDIDMKKISK